MTVATEELEVIETVRPIVELFRASVTALWATTYNVDLHLFNEFLLGRLGDPPLNVVILADHRRLATGLARVAPEQVSALHAVNSRWLLRAVRPGGQAFHPKTYLAVHRSRATLLVGSGNLSRGGLDQGHEVFTTFSSGTPSGDAAIAAWRTWMRRFVELVGDTALAARFRDLEERLPELAGLAVVGDPPLLHNLDTPIADQLAHVVVEGANRWRNCTSPLPSTTRGQRPSDGSSNSWNRRRSACTWGVAPPLTAPSWPIASRSPAPQSRWRATTRPNSSTPSWWASSPRSGRGCCPVRPTSRVLR